jgi:hypothetical protein
MGGLCAEKKTCSRDPSWLQIARCMYHMDFNVVKQFFLLAGQLASGGQAPGGPL